ncbi:MAG: hypothetical protein LUE20_00490 [Oscillospiraceae bacterium]|nr:hypothetical protein [Oscillospiraceae bacterium]
MCKIDHVSHLCVVYLAKMVYTVRVATTTNTANTTAIYSAIDNGTTALESQNKVIFRSG